MSRPRKPALPLLLAAFVVLAALVGVQFQEAFVHTDDGCEVELHCLACRLAIGTTAVAAAAAPLPSSLEMTGDAPAPPVSGAPTGVVGSQSSRAPPSRG